MRHPWSAARAALLCAALACGTGCALRHPTAGHRLDGRPADASAAAAPEDSLESYMAKIRHLTARPVVGRGGAAVPTLEQRDPGLAAALLALSLEPSPAAHRAVANRYRALGVADSAYRHYSAAVRMDPGDAAAYDGLARTWRDWGFPDLALADAYRAVFWAPESAPAHNTLGTVLHALGRRQGARNSYERARQLDGAAAYAVNNLCYLSFVEGEFDAAARSCRAALTLDPRLRAARNNLGLTQAAAGDLDQARRTLMDAADQAGGYFNMGIIYMATGDYARAASAFDNASRARPSLQDARRRAMQARQHARRSARGVAP